MATILIVDDQASVREFLVRLLARDGRRLLEAADGAEALDKVRAQRPDLVLTDILMPRVDGYEFVRRLRADPAFARAPEVIFLSAAYHEQEARALAHALGVRHLLVKPSHPQTVLRAVDQVLAAVSAGPPPPPPHDIGPAHRSLLTNKLADKVAELEAANGRLAALAAGGRLQSERLQALSRRLTAVQEEERRRIARELHDDIGQMLTGLRIVLEDDPNLSAEAARRKLTQARPLVDGLLTRVRDLSFGLRPALLDHLGLLPALLRLFEQYTQQTGVRVACRHEGLGRRFGPERETAAYRIVQEALTNVARHAGVKEAAVRLWVEADVLGVQVQDHGAGFDPGAVPPAGDHCGLAGVYERVALLGGELLVESAPGAGSQLTALFPLNSVPSADAP